MIVTKNSSLVQLLMLWVFLVGALADEDAFEPVCSLDYTLIQLSDGSGVSTEQQRKLQEESEGAVLPPAITLVRQSGGTVEFTVQNTTAFQGDATLVPEHVFVESDKNAFGSPHCTLHEDMGPLNDPGSSTDTLRAFCNYDTPETGPFALVRIYVRSSASAEGSGGATIPMCCQDPYAADAADSHRTVEFIYEIYCSAKCENPDNYFDNDDNDDGEEPTHSPTVFPTEIPTFFPSVTMEPTPVV